VSTRKSERDRLGLLQGTLDLLILRTLVFGAQHGQGIARYIEQQSDDNLLIDHGFALPCPAASRDARADRRRVGHVGEQPQGAFL
jgi:hypothetical protein